MVSPIEKIEEIYESLYQISLQISELIERELYSELVSYLSKKDQLLSESAEQIEKVKDIEVNTEKLKVIVQKYQEQERKNLIALAQVKDSIKKELSMTAQNSKLVGAYRSNKENIQGNILDFSE